MSDSDRDSTSVAADAVGVSRDPAGKGTGRPATSMYVAMPDGCRLAVDVYLPPDAPGGCRRS